MVPMACCCFMMGAAGWGRGPPWHSILTVKTLGGVFSMVLTSGFAKLLGSVSLEFSSDLEKFQLPPSIHPGSPYSYSKSNYNTLVSFTPYSLCAVVTATLQERKLEQRGLEPLVLRWVSEDLCRHPSIWLLLLDFPAAVMFSSGDMETYSGGSSSVRAGPRKGWSYTLL